MSWYVNIIFLLTVSVAKAQTGPVETALSAAAVAKKGAYAELLMLNPASISRVHSVYMGGSALYGHDDRFTFDNDKEHEYVYHAYAIDTGRDLLFPAAFFYSRKAIKGGGYKNNYYIATLYDINPNFTAGLGVHSSDRFSNNDLRLGVMYSPSDFVNLAASYYGFINKNHLVVLGIESKPIEKVSILFGAKRRNLPYATYNVTDLDTQLSLAVENRISDFTIRLGVNSFFSKHIKQNKIHMSGGLGYEGPKISANYGLNLANMIHSFDLNIYF